jgi:hypothetical protein
MSLCDRLVNEPFVEEQDQQQFEKAQGQEFFEEEGKWSSPPTFLY